MKVDDDYTAPRCLYSPGERRGSKAMLRAGGHVDPGFVPAQHRVQSPTSGAWHPCECSRGRDHVGDLRATDAQSALAAPTVPPGDPVSAALEILSRPRPATEAQRVGPWPKDYVGCAAHGPCCGLPEDDPCWDRTDYLRPSEWMKPYGPNADELGRA